MTPEKKSQVLFNDEGVLYRDRIVTALRTMFPPMHETETRTGLARPSTIRASHLERLMRARNVYETEFESDQGQVAMGKRPLPKWELSVGEDELVEATAQEDSGGEDPEVRSAAEEAFKASGFRETPLSPSTNSGGKGDGVARDDRPRKFVAGVRCCLCFQDFLSCTRHQCAKVLPHKKLREANLLMLAPGVRTAPKQSGVLGYNLFLLF